MIDTIKFKIDVNKNIFEKLKELSIQTKRVDHENKTAIFNYINKKINVGSYNRKVLISCEEEGYASIEFSIPKIIYGHNVFLITSEEAVQGIREVYEKLTKELGEFPSYRNEWYISKLDLCYAWKFNNQEELEQVIKVLKSFNYLGFKKYIYKTSVMFTGNAYTIKYYDKYSEVIRHDFRELKKLGNMKLAYECLEYAKYVLRYEVSLRYKQIKYLFGDYLTLDKLFEYNLEDISSVYHNKFIKMDNKTLGIAEVSRLLNLKYGVQKGGRLYIFYRNYYSDNPLDRQIIKESYSYSQIWRNLKLIKNAGVGIVIEDNKNNLDINIPSDNNVNKKNNK